MMFHYAMQVGGSWNFPVKQQQVNKHTLYLAKSFYVMQNLTNALDFFKKPYQQYNVEIM